MKSIMSKTGWTKEDWKEHILNYILWGAVLGGAFILPGLA